MKVDADCDLVASEDEFYALMSRLATDPELGFEEMWKRLPDMEREEQRLYVLLTMAIAYALGHRASTLESLKALNERRGH